MNIVGINAFNHDASACIIANNSVMACVEEEKISRQKHSESFPVHSLRECLSLAGLTGDAVNVVAIPRVNSVEIRSHLQHMLRNFPASLHLLAEGSAALGSDIKKGRYFHLKSRLKQELSSRVEIIEVPHHEAHAASVFYQSGYDRALIVVADGIAEFDTLWIGTGENGNLSCKARQPFPDSLGMAYAAVTEFLGFRAFDDEWKVMGMAAYGKPRYYEELNGLIEVQDDLSIRLNHRIFAFQCYGRNKWFHDDFRLRSLRRSAEAPLLQEHFDFAASFQAVFEDKLLALLRNVKRAHPEEKKLCLSGGVFLNCLFNGKLAQEQIFEEVYVDCNPGDAGAALGAAVHAHHQLTGYYPEALGHQNSLSRGFSADEIGKALSGANMSYREMSSVNDVANLLAENKILGLFQGRGEYGPRALGARSIIADPRAKENKDIINARVKYREAFRPFAPSILHEHQGEFFSSSVFSPYMSFAVRAKPHASSVVPAVIHEDQTARIQSVTRGASPFYHELITAFRAQTGVPMLLNTSFNIRGEPIVYTPSDAINTFRRANLDCLVMPPFIAFPS